MHFKEPYILEEYGVRDSVVSNSVSKREAYITRHLLTSDATHSLILSGSFYDRLWFFACSNWNQAKIITWLWMGCFHYQYVQLLSDPKILYVQANRQTF